MARKVYKTKNGITSYGIGLAIPGRKEKAYVYFTGGVTHPKFIPSTYTTEDPEIQKALEKWSNYGVKYELAATFKTEDKKAPVVQPEAVDTPTEENPPQLKAFTNTTVQSAVVTLIKQGWSGNSDEIVTVEDIQEAAKSVGITFPKLK